MQPRFTIENLEKLVEQLPVTSLHLISEKTGEKKFFPALAISDHNVSFATWIYKHLKIITDKLENHQTAKISISLVQPFFLIRMLFQ